MVHVIPYIPITEKNFKNKKALIKDSILSTDDFSKFKKYEIKYLTQQKTDFFSYKDFLEFNFRLFQIKNVEDFFVSFQTVGFCPSITFIRNDIMHTLIFRVHRKPDIFSRKEDQYLCIESPDSFCKDFEYSYNFLDLI